MREVTERAAGADGGALGREAADRTAHTPEQNREWLFGTIWQQVQRERGKGACRALKLTTMGTIAHIHSAGSKETQYRQGHQERQQ